jgi:hypothetical protein
MKKFPLLFLSLIAIALCSFAMFETQEMGGVSKLKYEQYLSLFKKIELPYQVALDTAIILKPHRIDGSFSHFHDGLSTGGFSRMGPSNYYAEALVVSNEKINVVLYSVVRPRSRNDYSYYLQSIDAKGNVIMNLFLVSLNDRTKNTCQINKDLSIVVFNEKRQQRQVIQIYPDGKMEEINSKTAMAD